MLGQLIEDLHLLNQTTEQAFLKIGATLTEFSAAVNLISSELTALARWEHAVHASEALTCALDRSTEMRARYADGYGGLGGMRQEAGGLRQTLTGFQGTVSAFRTLSLLTRIEIARIGSAGAGFGSLADEVKVLAGNIQISVEFLLDTASLLIPSIESAMEEISALEEGQTKDLPSAISGVSANLASFRDIQSRARESSVRLGAQYHAILEAFGKLIVSIQFQDITRQQIEHVIEVLQRFRSESEGENGQVPRDQGCTATVLAVQSSQLADAGEKFAASAKSVTHNLDDIAARVRGMAEESRTLSGLSEDEQNPFFLQMERGCTSILSVLSHCVNAEAATRAVGRVLAERIGRMRRPVEDIRAIEMEMRRMAMNARIGAVHLGAMGDTLGALADSMQQQAVESRQRSESIVARLDSMSGAAARLSGQGEPALAGEPGSEDACVEGMRAAVAELHSSSECGSAQIARIIASGTNLSEDLFATCRSFSVGALFAEAVSRARAMLNEIGEASCFSADGETPERGLADFATHYTMQSERDVHENVSATGAGRTGAAARRPSEPEAEQEGELGENVEFF
jgi:methyl-accepting chemotaxis protein